MNRWLKNSSMAWRREDDGEQQVRYQGGCVGGRLPVCTELVVPCQPGQPGGEPYKFLEGGALVSLRLIFTHSMQRFQPAIARAVFCGGVKATQGLGIIRSPGPCAVQNVWPSEPAASSFGRG